MGKYLNNGWAFFRGTVFCVISKIRSGIKIQGKIRLFKGSEIQLDKGSRVEIGTNVKIRERSFISAHKDAVLNLGKNVSVGMDNKIVCHERIEIGEGTLLSPNVLIYDHDHVFSKINGVERKQFKTSPIRIGKNCWIGANTVILRGTTIGDNCVVGAGCVIKGAYLAGSVIIQKRETEIQ